LCLFSSFAGILTEELYFITLVLNCRLFALTG
jgi:hypothetical protein